MSYLVKILLIYFSIIFGCGLIFKGFFGDYMVIKSIYVGCLIGASSGIVVCRYIIDYWRT